jgi:hypothetical protein
LRVGGLRSIIDDVQGRCAKLSEAVAERFYAVNGRHVMSADDDAYVSRWYIQLEELAEGAALTADEICRLMLANRLPLPSYIRSDGAQMVARDLLELLNEAGGADKLPEWFAAQFPTPEEAIEHWDAYLSGQYVCLREVRPEVMRRKNELVGAISGELEAPQPESASCLVRLHALADELDAIEPPFAPYDRLRFGGPVSRDRLIEEVRKRYPRMPAAVTK